MGTSAAHELPQLPQKTLDKLTIYVHIGEQIFNYESILGC